jgi:hypothetical protein
MPQQKRSNLGTSVRVNNGTEGREGGNVYKGQGGDGRVLRKEISSYDGGKASYSIRNLKRSGQEIGVEVG